MEVRGCRYCLFNNNDYENGNDCNYYGEEITKFVDGEKPEFCKVIRIDVIEKE